ncbi:MAG: hypothetical protein JW989_00490, partial [Chlorobiaceae bacterium]|nr:hypothetical protein [Chlorobiaceae bacterium]
MLIAVLPANVETNNNTYPSDDHRHLQKKTCHCLNREQLRCYHVFHKTSYEIHLRLHQQQHTDADSDNEP